MAPQEYTLCQLANNLGFTTVQTLQAFAKKAPSCYGRVVIPKDKQNPTKGLREINPPTEELKQIQRLLLEKVLYHINTLRTLYQCLFDRNSDCTYLKISE